MTGIDTNLLGRLNGPAAEPASEKARTELGQEAFFELMIAQLKAQDPTKPLDSTEYLSQLTQFSSLNSLQGLQKSLDSLSSSLQSMQALQASSLVGRSVMIEGDSAYLAADGGVRGRVELPPGTTGASLSVLDAGGVLVHRQALSASVDGPTPFAWDGLAASGEHAPAGVYRLRIEGQLDGGARGFLPQVEARVQSVTLGHGGVGTTLNLPGLGALDLGSVREIL